MYDIEIYIDKNGNSEIKEYIKYLKQKDSKDNKIKFNKIVAYIKMLQKRGLSLGEPYIKHLDSNIWELRPLKDRILFVYYDNNKFILLNIFKKKTQKTPIREIKKAKKLFKDYIGRDKNE